MVSIELRDQLIKSIISQFEEQCRGESLNRSDNTGEQAGENKGGRGVKNATASVECQRRRQLQSSHPKKKCIALQL